VQTISHATEAELLARCQAGDADAWEALFDAHYAPTSRFVFQLASDFTREDVEEVCQEVFLTVIKNLHTFQGHSQFQTWLFRIAANKARDYRQRQHAAKRGGGQVLVPLDTAPNDDSENGYTIDPPTTQPGPDLALINSERLSVVGEALEQLGGPCQEIIELRYFADLSYEEIAASLELNPKTVSSRLSKCLDKLEGVTRALLARQETPVAEPGTLREKKAASSV
jgi:RNA polymerase sigma-70 factor (ECF subfamily)